MESGFRYSVLDFSKSLKSSFIESDPTADNRYAPRILENDERAGTNVLSVLKRELRDCVSFDFSVAFITDSGIQTLIPLLLELQERGVPGRILTSTYLSFNDPGALRTLLGYSNIQTRVYQGEHHAKGYFFDRRGLSTIIIGSSNLTQKALTCNKEWNILFHTYEHGELLGEAKRAFDALWNSASAVPLTSAWIDGYEAFRRQHRVRWQESFASDGLSGYAVLSGGSEAPRVPAGVPVGNGTPAGQAGLGNGTPGVALPRARAAGGDIVPNRMQALALEALDVLHSRNEPRALLVSATGTGKTYLSALDVRATRPARVLFVAHRKRILAASLQSFRRVLKGTYSYAMHEGGRPQSATCLFAMVGTLSRHLHDFAPDAFDYIIVDEAHRTGAASYQAILDHFRPAFCLGMTATPSRTDGYDVYSLFNHVIAYRITLQDALDNDMLVPFHYFGIADLDIDDQAVDDFGLFTRLTSEERVRHITRKIEEYTVDKANRRGLIFCNRNEEAAQLSAMFNSRGYRTVAISGATSDTDRDAAIARLERGDLQYIFSVDILNEGVDIPSLNQIIMLRRTESAIVFVQQLGRGLRKHQGKEYTLVLDFIGNYQKNYLVPIALSGDRTYNKDNLRKTVKEGSTVIPGCSTISFDRISEARIFKALEQGRFGQAKLIRGEYEHLKQVLGRIPSLVEFDENESIDPMLIIRKYGSYAAFLEKYEDGCGHAFGKQKLEMLKFLSQKLACGKRRDDLLILRRLVEEAGGPTTAAYGPGLEAGGSAVAARVSGLEAGGPAVAAARTKAALNVLSGSYSTAGVQLVVGGGANAQLSVAFAKALEDVAFRTHVLDAIEFGLARNDRYYRDTYKDTDFVLNAKYSREEICRLLRWDKEPNYQNIGGYFHDKATNTFPVFINYEKDPSISITTMYEDRFVSDRELVAISKSNRTIASPEIASLRNAASNGMRCFLFVRKNKEDKDDGKEFYFLGEMHPTGEFRQIVMQGTTTSAVEITYRLETPVKGDLYDYFLSDLDVDAR